VVTRSVKQVINFVFNIVFHIKMSYSIFVTSVIRTNRVAAKCDMSHLK